MSPLPGFGLFLVRWSQQGSSLELRFFTGYYPPEEGVDPVVYVTVENLANAQEITAQLREDKACESYAYLSEPEPNAIQLDFEYDASIVLRGKSVTVRTTNFEAEDFEHFTKQQHQQNLGLHDSLTKMNSRISSAKILLDEQARRISVKAKGHLVGSTARTLYEQQLAFINRVLSALDT